MSIKYSKLDSILNAKGNAFDINKLLVSAGAYSDISFNHKFGSHPDADTGANPGDAWDLGTTYVYSTDADIDSISSSNAADTQSVTVIGLDTNWDEVSQNVTLSGTTRVALSTDLIRVYRMYNNGGSDFAGNVYCYVNSDITDGVPDSNSKIRAVIRGDINQTLMATVTVPNSNTMFVYSGYANMQRNATASACDISFKIRDYGSVFNTKHYMSLHSYGGAYNHNFAFPLKVTQKSDIKVTIEYSSRDDALINVGFDYITVANSLLNDIT